MLDLTRSGGSPALLVIGLRPTLRTGFCEALVLGLKRFAGRSWIQNVTVKTAFRSDWPHVGIRSSLLHQKCGRASFRGAGQYLSGISVRKIAGVTEALSRVRIGKDAVSRIASRLEEEQKAWRERPLE